MIKVKFRVALAVIMVAIAILANATIALAAIAVAMSDVFVSRNLYVTGDMFIHGIYDIQYATLPTPSVRETFALRFLSPDGLTEIAYNTGYPYHDRGYGKGLFSFYIPANIAPTWGLNYIIRVDESPLYFTSPVAFDFVLSASNYSLETDQIKAQTELKYNLLSVLDVLGREYAITTEWLAPSDLGTVLSSAGEIFLRNVIPGIQSICPGLFYVQNIPVELSPRPWGTPTQSDTYRNRFNNTWVGDALTSMGTLLNTDYSMAGSIITLVLVFIWLTLGFRFCGDVGSGKYPGALTYLNSVLLGWTPMIAMAAILFVCFIYIGSKVANKMMS
jgi:hypothetical protein